jgi:hypothetical protein
MTPDTNIIATINRKSVEKRLLLRIGPDLLLIVRKSFHDPGGYLVQAIPGALEQCPVFGKYRRQKRPCMGASPKLHLILSVGLVFGDSDQIMAG